MASMNGRLCATGVVSLVMVMNLRRFVRFDDSQAHGPLAWLTTKLDATQAPASVAAFERLRGSSVFADFLKRHLQPGAPFRRDEEESRIETQGHELSVFRQYLIDTYFFPTYQLTDSALAIVEPSLVEDATLKEHLKAWTFKVRLTRNGMAVVKLERSLDQVPFSAISAMIQETQRFLPTQNRPDEVRVPTQWQLAMDVVALFVKACRYQFTIPAGATDGRSPQTLNLHDTYRKDRLPLHDRHIVYLFSAITVDGQAVTMADLKSRHAHEVVGLLENSLVLGQDTTVYPNYKPEIIDKIFDDDTATWQDEICLLTPESTFIWQPTLPDKELVVGGGKSAARTGLYQDYWHSIARGIEHIIALKNELQLIERETTRLLEMVPDITRRATDGTLNRGDRRAINDLATGIATLFRSLPQQRDLLVPSSVFRWSAAYRKFHRLMQLLGIYEIERHIQTNVEELNAFLAHFNSIQIQYDAQRASLRFARLTLIFSLMIIPSCVADSVQVLQNDVVVFQLAGHAQQGLLTLAAWLSLTPLDVVVLIGLAAVVIALALVWIWRRWMRV